jgi:hypothetical protein
MLVNLFWLFTFITTSNLKQLPNGSQIRHIREVFFLKLHKAVDRRKCLHVVFT